MDEIKEYSFNPPKPEIVNGIGCVVRFFSKTKLSNFKKLVDNIASIHFDVYIFIMDRVIESAKTDTEENENKNEKLNIGKYKPLTKEEMKLLKIISKSGITKETNILVSNTHYSGTGSFNIAFNFIRKRYSNKNYLWQFCDDDDTIDIDKFNLLINCVVNHNKDRQVKLERNNKVIELENEQYKAKITYTEAVDSPEKQPNEKTKGISRTKIMTCNITEAEETFFDNFDKFQFTTDLIINHATATKTHLFDSMYTSGCNLWSYLFSPVYFHNLTCRLLPFGREDLDMINYLMNAAGFETYTGLYKGIIQSNEGHEITFNIPNNLIRINSIVKSHSKNAKEINTLSVYTYEGQSQGLGDRDSGRRDGYKALKGIYNFDNSVLNYMNNHQRLLQNGNPNVKQFPVYKSIGQNQQFYFNHTNSYSLESDEYGVKTLETYTRTKTPNKIPLLENIYGELFIASYELYDINIKLIDVFNMFMNGKNVSDINKHFLECFKEINQKQDVFAKFGQKQPSEKTSDDEYIELLKALFDSIFMNPDAIIAWNTLYYKLTHEGSMDSRIVVPTHVFGGKKSMFWSKLLKILIFFFILSVIIVVITLCVNRIESRRCKHVECSF